MAGRPPTKEQTEFGKRLMALRKAKGLTQVEFATMLGVSQKTANYYERTAANPSLELINRLAEFLDVAPAELLVDEPTKPKRRPGRKSRLDDVVEKIRELPRAEQLRIVEQMEDSLEGAIRRARASQSVSP
jgi:transcriptional regulator with XRE-family HTH domain